ncbi:MAG: DUF488 domain-containing protein [Litorilinea sp.]
MMVPQNIPILTIGYGARTLDAFVDLLHTYHIEYLVDVRSAPYSRFKPEFSRDALAQTVVAQGVRYLYWGDVLGGRPDDSTCYIDGKVDYATIKTKAWYQQGIRRLETAFAQGQRVALMCSEGKPEQCHRSKLLAASLVERGVDISHIDETGALKSQEDVILALTGGQLYLFDEIPFTSRKRYTDAPDPRSHPDENLGDIEASMNDYSEDE